MNRSRKFIALLIVFSVLFSMCSCSKTSGSGKGVKKADGIKPERVSKDIQNTPFATPGLEPSVTPVPNDDGIEEFYLFNTTYGEEKSEFNEIREIIAKTTGVRVIESWLYDMTPDEAIGSIIASGKLPDMIYSYDNYEFYNNNLLIAWDDYLEEYPNIKALYTDEQWEQFRQDDGHIYWVDAIDRYKNKDTRAVHNEQAFWIQVRVLEWAGYPKIETLDQYFELLDKYSQANPNMPDGTPVIPFTCICEDWRYYSIESAPMYLDGYPNNGCVIVNVDEGEDKPKVIDYNTTDTAKAYFRKLNEEYNKGVIDPNFAVQTYDEYISKVTTGRVLGLSDMYWDFAYNLMPEYSLKKTAEDGTEYTLYDLGCEYVPLGLVMEYGAEQQWHSYGSEINALGGLAVTTQCYDPETAFRFINDLLSDEILTLRFWGIETVDYYISEDGIYFRTEEMRRNWNDLSYREQHTCEYTNMPQWRGLFDDGINRILPSEQPVEFKAELSQPAVACLDVYGADNFVDFIGSKYCEPYPWYPLYYWSNSLTTDTEAGLAWYQMTDCKHEWIPKLVLSKDFDSDWDKYMKAYEECDPQVFIDAAQQEVNNRLT